ncbi:type III glutamate--ammonia ligase [Granulosicoccaceae sp. 1_MG-2023]|nr:type III glutamate--ammonia ligase [Granulosicoccaceae sp. 1_MG-2023]
MQTVFNDPIAPEVLAPLKNAIEQQQIRYLIPSYVDLHGIPKTKIVPTAFLEKMLKGSECFTGAALDGVPQDLSDNEVCAVPDPGSFINVPWRPDCGWFASDLWLDGKPFEHCIRGRLKRVLDKADRMGFTVNTGVEAEFYVFRDNDSDEPEPVSPRHHLDKPAYDTVRLMDNLDGWLDDVVSAMNELGWHVYSFDHEDGIGQFELDFDFSDALTMADRFVFLRVLVGEYARRHGAFASFMPKPYGDKAGSGAHYNISLADKNDGKNLFSLAPAEDPHGFGLTTLGYQFIAGVMRHLPAIQALSAPTVNSYKRLVMKGSTSGYTWAPCFTSWGGNNRTNTLRIPGGGGRVELRSADSACNPYMGFAMMIAAGLEGIEQELTPTPPNRVNLYLDTEQARADKGIYWLPRDLAEAADALEADSLAHEVFGDTLLQSWLDFKRQEYLEYQLEVSQWERKRYLKMF